MAFPKSDIYITFKCGTLCHQFNPDIEMFAKPARKQSAKARATRQKLINAAAEEFREIGYFKTDTNKIAVRAGYAPATFYKHFINKLEIFLAAYEEWVAEEWQALNSSDSNTPESLIRIVLAHHKKYLLFRTDLRALAATERTVKQYQNKLRREQVKRLAELAPELGPNGADWSTPVFLLLIMERVSDAIADGSAKASHADEEKLIAHLVSLIKSIPSLETSVIDNKD
ncbi:MAG: TetR/AcrR family transcriptional regulator [Pseudomonadota bacterium]